MFGLEIKLGREVDTEAAWGPVVEKMMTRIMLAAHAEVSQPGRVPLDKGHLRASLAPGGGVTATGGSYAEGYYAAVGTNLVYGRVLEESPSALYRHGPSTGSNTAGWLSSTGTKIGGEIQAAASEAAKELAEAFARG